VRAFYSLISFTRLFATAALVFCVAAILLCTLGCNRRQGPVRYDFSGSVTYNGKAVPLGSVVFLPDKSKGNDGPGATAAIIDGSYSTMPGRGAVGGPHIAQISGFDGKAYQVGHEHHPMGRMVFPTVRLNVDLPKESGKYDFVLPAQNK
jgi:hypothetical protein